MTDIDMAIEAAALQAGHVLDETSLQITSRKYLIDKDVTVGTIELAIHQHIDPVVEAMVAVGVDLMNELSELKAMVRRYLPDDDGDDMYDHCLNCNEKVHYNDVSVTNYDRHCQNTECVAFKLRKATKEN